MRWRVRANIGRPGRTAERSGSECLPTLQHAQSPREVPHPRPNYLAVLPNLTQVK